MVSSAGRGRPRPLLAGVYRKACDYCVRSKRGCNGGTPCEQCVRRGQQCTYSQRRKSGPRGRPARQAPVTDNCAPAVGTRIARKTKRSSFMSSRLSSSPMSATSSPARTASVSSSSSEYSPSEESSSDSEAEKSPVENCCEEVLIHVAKKGKISGCHPDEVKVTVKDTSTQQVSPSSQRRDEKDEKVPNVSNDSETRMEQPQDSLVARTASVVSRSKPLPNAQVSEKESGLNALPSRRSAWVQPMPVEQSTNLHPQQHDNSGPETLSNGMRIHEISMQSWEVSHAPGPHPRPVDCDRTQPGGSSTEGINCAANSTEASRSPQLSKPTDGLPGDVDVYNAMDTASVASSAAGAVNTHSPASSFGGSLLSQGEEELDGFDLDLEITKWEIPSLTREMSLARAVDALGGEQQTPGFDYDSSFVSGSWRFL